jgi:antitoxin ParD1/3/4
MTLSLSPQVEQMIRKRVESGQYASPEDVIVAGLASLERQEHFGDFEPGELQALVEEGERSGEPLDGEEVLAELDQLRRHLKDERR